MLTGAVETVSSGRDPAAVNRKIETVMRKLYSGFPTRTDTNRAVQSRGMKFWI